MKIIITGATGFLDRNLSESFHADGLQVTATGLLSKIWLWEPKDRYGVIS